MRQLPPAFLNRRIGKPQLGLIICGPFTADYKGEQDEAATKRQKPFQHRIVPSPRTGSLLWSEGSNVIQLRQIMDLMQSPLRPTVAQDLSDADLIECGSSQTP